APERLASAAPCGSGRSTSFIPAVPAAWSVTTIAFIRHLPLCLLSRSSTTSYLIQSYLSTSSLRSRHHHSNNIASRTGPLHAAARPLAGLRSIAGCLGPEPCSQVPRARSLRDNSTTV